MLRREIWLPVTLRYDGDYPELPTTLPTKQVIFFDALADQKSHEQASSGAEPRDVAPSSLRKGSNNETNLRISRCPLKTGSSVPAVNAAYGAAVYHQMQQMWSTDTVQRLGKTSVSSKRTSMLVGGSKRVQLSSVQQGVLERRRRVAARGSGLGSSSKHNWTPGAVVAHLFPFVQRDLMLAYERTALRNAAAELRTPGPFLELIGYLVYIYLECLIELRLPSVSAEGALEQLDLSTDNCRGGDPLSREIYTRVKMMWRRRRLLSVSPTLSAGSPVVVVDPVCAHRVLDFGSYFEQMTTGPNILQLKYPKAVVLNDTFSMLKKLLHSGDTLSVLRVNPIGALRGNGGTIVGAPVPPCQSHPVLAADNKGKTSSEANSKLQPHNVTSCIAQRSVPTPRDITNMLVYYVCHRTLSAQQSSGPTTFGGRGTQSQDIEIDAEHAAILLPSVYHGTTTKAVSEALQTKGVQHLAISARTSKLQILFRDGVAMDLGSIKNFVSAVYGEFHRKLQSDAVLRVTGRPYEADQHVTEVDRKAILRAMAMEFYSPAALGTMVPSTTPTGVALRKLYGEARTQAGADQMDLSVGGEVSDDDDWLNLETDAETDKHGPQGSAASSNRSELFGRGGRRRTPTLPSWAEVDTTGLRLDHVYDALADAICRDRRLTTGTHRITLQTTVSLLSRVLHCHTEYMRLRGCGTQSFSVRIKASHRVIADIKCVWIHRKCGSAAPWSFPDCFDRDTKLLRVMVPSVAPDPSYTHPATLDVRLQRLEVSNMLRHYWAMLLEARAKAREHNLRCRSGGGGSERPIPKHITLGDVDIQTAMTILRHHEAFIERKQGCGVDTVYVADHPSPNCVGPSFWVKRVCGVSEDFYYRSAFDPTTGMLRTPLVAVALTPKTAERGSSAPANNPPFPSAAASYPNPPNDWQVVKGKRFRDDTGPSVAGGGLASETSIISHATSSFVGDESPAEGEGVHYIYNPEAKVHILATDSEVGFEEV